MQCKEFLKLYVKGIHIDYNANKIYIWYLDVMVILERKGSPQLPHLKRSY